jgi:hypothetical protein
MYSLMRAWRGTAAPPSRAFSGGQPNKRSGLPNGSHKSTRLTPDAAPRARSARSTPIGYERTVERSRTTPNHMPNKRQGARRRSLLRGWLSAQPAAAARGAALPACVSDIANFAHPLDLKSGGLPRRRRGLRVEGAVLAEAQVVSPRVDDIEGSFSPWSFYDLASRFAVDSVRREDLKSLCTLMDVLHVVDGEEE